jgi:hypothetical protein
MIPLRGKKFSPRRERSFPYVGKNAFLEIPVEVPFYI